MLTCSWDVWSNSRLFFKWSFNSLICWAKDNGYDMISVTCLSALQYCLARSQFVLNYLDFTFESFHALCSSVRPLAPFPNQRFSLKFVAQVLNCFLCFSFLLVRDITLFSYSRKPAFESFHALCSSSPLPSHLFQISGFRWNLLLQVLNCFLCFSFLFSSSITLSLTPESSPSRAFTRSAPAVRLLLTFSKSAVFAEICSSGPQLFCVLLLFSSSITLFSYSRKLAFESFHALCSAVRSPSPFPNQRFSLKFVLQVLNCFMCFSFLFVRASRSSLTQTRLRELTRSSSSPLPSPFPNQRFSLKFVLQVLNCFLCFSFLFSSSITLFSYSKLAFESFQCAPLQQSAPLSLFPNQRFSLKFVASGPQLFSVLLLSLCSSITLFLLQKARLRELSRALLQQSAPLSPFPNQRFSLKFALQVLNCFCASPFSLVRASRSSLTPESSPSRAFRSAPVRSLSPFPNQRFSLKFVASGPQLFSCFSFLFSWASLFSYSESSPSSFHALAQQSAPLSLFPNQRFSRNLLLQVLNCFMCFSFLF